ncbi:MAG: hypothetical protein GY719_29055 [bacterium]|nr:hypothetical protein [bacterium]
MSAPWAQTYIYDSPQYEAGYSPAGRDSAESDGEGRDPEVEFPFLALGEAAAVVRALQFELDRRPDRGALERVTRWLRFIGIGTGLDRDADGGPDGTAATAGTSVLAGDLLHSLELYGLVDSAGDHVELTELALKLIAGGARARGARLKALCRPGIFRQLLECRAGDGTFDEPRARDIAAGLGLGESAIDDLLDVFSRSARYAGAIDDAGRFTAPAGKRHGYLARLGWFAGLHRLKLPFWESPPVRGQAQTDHPEAACMVWFYGDSNAQAGGEVVGWTAPGTGKRLHNLEPLAVSLWEGIFSECVPEVHQPDPVRALWRYATRAFECPTGTAPRLATLDPDRVLATLREVLVGWDLEPDVEQVHFLRRQAEAYCPLWSSVRTRAAKTPQVYLAWKPREQAGFFFNRLFSYGTGDDHDHATGIVEIGSLVPALRRAWKCLWRSWTGGDEARRRPLRIRTGMGKTEQIYAWVERFAHDQGVEIWDNEVDGLDGCLVRTEHKDVVHLSMKLPIRRRAWVVCHELAHLELQHLANSSYRCDSRRLNSEGVLYFERQEREADALASLWMHLFEGLTELFDDVWIGVSEQPGEQPDAPEPTHPAARTAPTRSHFAAGRPPPGEP